MSFVFEARTAEELRLEIVAFLEREAESYRAREKMYTTKHKAQLEREKAYVLQSAADHIRWAQIVKPSPLDGIDSDPLD